MNKALIQKRFEKNLNTYNENAIIQKEMAKKLITLCSAKNYNNILEIGCGTGFLTELVYKNIEFQSYTAVDIVGECKNHIENISPKINFIQADIEEFIDKHKTKYDLIISNATFQWFKKIEDFIPKLLEKLNPNGCLLFSTFGPENFKEIRKITGKTLSYKSKDEYKIFLPNPHIEEEIRTLSFATPKDVLKHLKHTGVNALETTIWTKANLSDFEKDYRALCPNSFELTYHPIFIKIGQ